MKRILLFLSVFFITLSYCQSVTNTYVGGDISTPFNAFDATCNGPLTTLVINIPAGANVTSTNVSYNFTATGGGGGWENEQMSQIYCQETNTDEGGYIDGGNVGGLGGAGTLAYNRVGLGLANGVSATGTLTFEMRAFRQWEGTAGCNTIVQLINNGTWSITVNYTIPAAQTYTSSTVTQNNTDNLPICNTDQEIIGIQVEMNGALTPLDITAFRLRTTNSTDPVNDLTNIKIYYTGTSNVFSPVGLFNNNAPVAVATNFTINGSQTLQSGTNYFWVAYDLDPTGTVGNDLDARCNRITIDGTNYVPNTTNPGGVRTISICDPSPGGTSIDPLIWLKASAGTTPAAGTAPLTAWSNQGTYADPIGVHGTDWGVANPTFNANGYNFNEKIHFNGNYNYLSLTNNSGVTFGSAYFVIMNDNTAREYQHLLTWYDVSSSPHVDGSFHGGGGIGTANFNLPGYNVEFAGLAATDAWRIDGIAIGSEDPVNTTHQIVSAVAKNGDLDAYADRILGGQHGEGGNPTDLPDRDWSGDVSEIILLDGVGTAAERNQIESYLATKFGRTLGVNGTSKNYTMSNGTNNWTIAANAGFNYDITGISRDDKTTQDQRKSHTEMFTGATRNDILTVANGTNFATPSAFTADFSSFLWGHNNDPIINTGAAVSYPTDNGATIQAIFQREWKAEETGTVGTVTLEFDMSTVLGVNSVPGTNDLANLILLVDEDGDFTNGATAISPSSFSNATDIAYFQHDFQPTDGNNMTQNNGFYFTLGSINFNATPLPVEILEYSVAPNTFGQALNTWVVKDELNIDYYIIEKSTNGIQWEYVGQIDRTPDNANMKSYELIDELPYQGLSYYRLTEIDTDGNLGGQIIRPFETDNTISLDIYPNPSNGTVNLLINGNIDNISEIIVINPLGQIERNVSKGNSHIIEINNLGAGLHSVMVTNNNGEKLVKKFIVKN